MLFTVIVETKLAPPPSLRLAFTISIFTPPTRALYVVLLGCTWSGYCWEETKVYLANSVPLKNHLRTVDGKSIAEQVKFTSGHGNKSSDEAAIKFGEPEIKY